MTGHKTHKCSSHDVCIKASHGDSWEILAGARLKLSSTGYVGEKFLDGLQIGPTQKQLKN